MSYYIQLHSSSSPKSLIIHKSISAFSSVCAYCTMSHDSLCMSCDLQSVSIAALLFWPARNTTSSSVKTFLWYMGGVFFCVCVSFMYIFYLQIQFCAVSRLMEIHLVVTFVTCAAPVEEWRAGYFVWCSIKNVFTTCYGGSCNMMGRVSWCLE